MNRIGIHEIVVHHRPHVEEIGGNWLARKFGEKRFPGIRTAQLVFGGMGGQLYKNESADEYWEPNGTLLLGVGAGRLDEHPGPETESKEGKCSFLLLAEALGVDRDPALRPIQMFLANNDLKGGSQPFDIAGITGSLYRQYPDEPEKAIAWVTRILDVKYREQEQFPQGREEDQQLQLRIQEGLNQIAKGLDTCDNDPALKPIFRFITKNRPRNTKRAFDLASLTMVFYQYEPEEAWDWAKTALKTKHQDQLQFLACEEVLEQAEVEEIDGPHGLLTMVTVETSNEHINRYARRAQAAIVIQKGTSGPLKDNVQVYTDHRKIRFSLNDAVKIIRCLEQAKKGLKATTNWKELCKEGKMLGAEEWYYQKATNTFLNGSTSAPDVDPTQLSLKAIQNAIRIAVNPRMFEPNHESECNQGRCTSTPQRPCGWYHYGLHRCRNLRFKEHEAKRQQ